MARCILAFLHQLLALSVNNLFQQLSLITDDFITICTFLANALCTFFLDRNRDKGAHLVDPTESENEVSVLPYCFLPSSSCSACLPSSGLTLVGQYGGKAVCPSVIRTDGHLLGTLGHLLNSSAVMIAEHQCRSHSPE